MGIRLNRETLGHSREGDEVLAKMACLSWSFAPWLLIAQFSTNMGAVPAITPTSPISSPAVQIRDHVGMFNSPLKRRAMLELNRSRRLHGVPVLIETFDSLDGRNIADVSQRRTRRAGSGGLYILVVARDRNVAVATTHDWLLAEERNAIRSAFLEPLKAGDTELSLRHGVRTIGEVLTRSDGSRSQRQPRNATALLTISIVLLVFVIAISLRGSQPREEVGLQ